MGAGLGLGYLLVRHPEIGPRFPDGFALWFVTITGITNQEDAVDAEALLIYLICFALVSLLTWVALTLWRRLKQL